MHFWDLIIDNHISEAVEFFKDPTRERSNDQLDVENAPATSGVANNSIE